MEWRNYSTLSFHVHESGNLLFIVNELKVCFPLTEGLQQVICTIHCDLCNLYNLL